MESKLAFSFILKAVLGLICIPFVLGFFVLVLAVSPIYIFYEFGDSVFRRWRDEHGT